MSDMTSLCCKAFSSLLLLLARLVELVWELGSWCCVKLRAVALRKKSEKERERERESIVPQALVQP